MEMFAGALTGSGTSAGIQDAFRRRYCNGMLSVYFSLDYFHSDDWFAQEVRNYIEFYKDSRPAEPDGEVLIPGEVDELMKERMNTRLPCLKPPGKTSPKKQKRSASVGNWWIRPGIFRYR